MKKQHERGLRKMSMIIDLVPASHRELSKYFQIFLNIPEDKNPLLFMYE